MRRFVPVPYDALGLCGSDRERLCVLRLYREAHGFKWRPMRLAVREFASWSDLRLADAVELLRSLEEAGLIRRDESARRGASTIEVFDPASAGGTQTGRSLERRSEHYDEPPDEPDERSAERMSERRTEHLTRDEDTRAVEPNPNRTRTDDPPPNPPPSGGGQDDQPDRAAQVAALAERDLDDVPAEAARARALTWLQPSGKDVGRLFAVLRETRLAPAGLRRRDVAEGVAEAARRWLARQRDAPDPGAELALVVDNTTG